MEAHREFTGNLKNRNDASWEVPNCRYVDHWCGLVTLTSLAQVRLVWLQESGAWAKSFLGGRVPQWDKWDTIFVLFLLRQQAPVFQGRPWGPLSCYRGAGYGDVNPRMSIKPAGGHRANLSAMFVFDGRGGNHSKLQVGRRCG